MMKRIKNKLFFVEIFSRTFNDFSKPIALLFHQNAPFYNLSFFFKIPFLISVSSFYLAFYDQMDYNKAVLRRKYFRKI